MDFLSNKSNRWNQHKDLLPLCTYMLLVATLVYSTGSVVTLFDNQDQCFSDRMGSKAAAL